MELPPGPVSHFGETRGTRRESKVRPSVCRRSAPRVKPRPPTESLTMETHGQHARVDTAMICDYGLRQTDVCVSPQEDVKSMSIKDEPREMGQYLHLPAGKYPPVTRQRQSHWHISCSHQKQKAMRLLNSGLLFR